MLSVDIGAARAMETIVLLINFFTLEQSFGVVLLPTDLLVCLCLIACSPQETREEGEEVHQFRSGK